MDLYAFENPSFSSGEADKVRGAQPQQLNVADLPVPEMKGRLEFQKIKLEEVKRIAQEKWQPQGDWKIIPLGKGFFMIRLTCEEDLRKIWGGGPWKFGDQILRLSKWMPDFDPTVHRTSTAAVWVKFPKLGQQYWDYEILMSIARGLGNPVGVDKHTLNRDFGFFALVLVEIDLAKPIPGKILVEEGEGKSFLQEVEVDKLSKFCPHCKVVGHIMAECTVMRRIRDGETTVRSTASKPNEQLPESTKGKEAPVLDQPAWQRKKYKRNRRKKINNAQVLNAGVSGMKDARESLIEAYATEPGDIFQDSISELEETTQTTTDIEVRETVDAANSPNQTTGTLGSAENARTLIGVVNTGDQVIVLDRIEDQVGGTLHEGEHTGCGISSYDDSHRLQMVVAEENDPIVSFKSPINTLRAQNEANSLLASTCWADMDEEAEESERAEKEGPWRTQRKKATKSKKCGLPCHQALVPVASMHPCRALVFA
ncbi:hypothetical protein IFM89_016459 [Coptis chinensis]|uniref:DUF4283 domain-containing protein n=1 Tax=Coptis chinensis TaxID=261450 RepID=A0A835LVW4_9MAGN|nr:hypothetical protein IFM89_016459 [Coptis chinensis]